MIVTLSLPSRGQFGLDSPPAVLIHAALNLMALRDSGRVLVEGFIDQEMVDAVKTGKVMWYDPTDEIGSRCDGVDPSLFKNGRDHSSEVPMKKWSPDHRGALEYYARAYRGKKVPGPTTYIIAGR